MRGLNLRSLRVRLTLWYCGALVLAACILGGASRWALAVSLDHALDQGLRYRLIGLHGFIDENSGSGLERLRTRLVELDRLGELFQVFGPRGELMAQSFGLARHHVSTSPPPDPGAGMLFRSAGPRWFPVRMATQRIYVKGEPLTIEVADPQAKFHSVLDEFYLFLSIAAPFVLAVAAMGGYWLSRQALKPVDQIIEEARALDSTKLHARLSVAPSGDELQRLAETLNQMLGRVEQTVLQMQQFTADASHELRAPMTLIHTAAEFALRRERSPEELKHALHKILREARRCTELINQLLTLARSDAASNDADYSAINLAELLQEVVAQATVLATDKGLQILTELPAVAIEGKVDAGSFRRMLLILVDNAVKYTPQGGVVTISLREEAAEVVIAVADSGVGIAAEQLPFIFDRFWRADRVRSRDAGGIGLGLAIAREIARSHGAAISVESTEGEGSTFTIRLPRETTDGSRPATFEQQAGQSKRSF